MLLLSHHHRRHTPEDEAVDEQQQQQQPPLPENAMVVAKLLSTNMPCTKTIVTRRPLSTSGDQVGELTKETRQPAVVPRLLASDQFILKTLLDIWLTFLQDNNEKGPTNCLGTRFHGV
jgi:hypothetical protein